MHAQSSTLPAFYADLNPSNTETLAVSEIRQPHAELEELLGTLRADPVIGSRISENEDGTYSFDMKAGGWSEQAFIASTVVQELNGAHFEISAAGGEALPSRSEAQLFKQMTGYNLLVLGGQSVVLDANGLPPALSDQRSVQEVLELVNNIAAFRAGGLIEGDLSSRNIGTFLSAFALMPQSAVMIDQLVSALNAKAEIPVSHEDTGDEGSYQIETLIHMISV